MLTRKLALAAVLPLMMGGVALAADKTPVAPQMPDRAEMHQTMCQEHYAHQEAGLTYLETRLQLTEKQKPAWAKYQQAKGEAAAKLRDVCLASPVPTDNTPPSILDRETHMEQMLTAQLENMRATRPALQALYDVLTPEQKALMDRMPPEGMHGHHHGGFGMGPGGMGGPGGGMGPGNGMGPGSGMGWGGPRQ